jgi:hypothetical protein
MLVIGVLEVATFSGAQGGAVDVDDQAIRRGQGEDAVLHRAGQVEDQPRVVRRTPQAHALDLSDGQSVNGHRCQQQPNDSDQCAYAHTYPTYCLIPCHGTPGLAASPAAKGSASARPLAGLW